MVNFSQYENNSVDCLERICDGIDEIVNLERNAERDSQIGWHVQEHGEFYALFIEVEIHRFARLVYRENYTVGASTEMNSHLEQLLTAVSRFPVWQDLAREAFAAAEQSILRLRAFSRIGAASSRTTLIQS